MAAEELGLGPEQGHGYRRAGVEIEAMPTRANDWRAFGAIKSMRTFTVS